MPRAIHLVLVVVILLLLCIAVTDAAKKKKKTKAKAKIDTPVGITSSGGEVGGDGSGRSASSEEDDIDEHNKAMYEASQVKETVFDSRTSSSNADKPNPSTDFNPNRESVNISKWEYCEGCKITVDAYSLRAYERLRDMQSKKVPEQQIVESGSLMEGICDASIFDLYEMPIKHSCIHIFNQETDGKTFMQVFEGKTSALTANNPSEVYSKRRLACGNALGACSAHSFSSPVKREDQTTCKACQTIADDLEMHLRVMKKQKGKKVKKMSITIDEVCAKLSHNHQPYSWLMDVCEELSEDRASQIADIKKFRDRVVATGLNPEKRLRDMICDEIFECDKPSSKHNKKPVDKSSTSTNAGNGGSTSANVANKAEIKSEGFKVGDSVQVQAGSDVNENDDDEEDAEL